MTTRKLVFPPWPYIPVYAGPSDSRLRQLFGTTPVAGAALCNSGTVDCGTVFELAPPAATGGTRTETVLQNFAGLADG